VAGEWVAQLERLLGAAHLRRDPVGGWTAIPGSAGEVAACVRLCREHRVVTLPVGAERRRLARDSTEVRISTARLRHIVQLDERSLLVHVQAGLTGLELDQTLRGRELSIGDYPHPVLASSLGGIVAVRTPGKSCARHGFFEDAVVGLSVVLPDGSMVQTRVAPRRATGPDLARVFCGSEGSLGIITSLVLRIHRRPQARFLRAYELSSVESAISAIQLALREEVTPAASRIYDAAAARAALGESVGRDAQAVLFVATAGLTDLAACDRDLVSSAVTAEGGREIDAGVAQIWWSQLHGGVAVPEVSSLQVTTPPSRVAAAYRAVIAAAEGDSAVVRGHIGRFDRDGAVLFFAFVVDGQELAADSVHPALLRAREAAHNGGGWALGVRSPQFDGYLDRMRATLDPQRIFSPGALRDAASDPGDRRPG
jgi:alkyldihydroxyacetonephosphate synthase